MAARYPKLAISPEGDMLRAWFVYVSGTSGPGTISAQFRGTGATAWTAAFTLVDDTGADIQVDELGWGDIAFGYSGDWAVEMTIVKQGDVAPTWWKSWDAEHGFKSFLKVTP